MRLSTPTMATEASVEEEETKTRLRERIQRRRRQWCDCGTE